MAKTLSTMIQLGTSAPNFTLPNYGATTSLGENISLPEAKSNIATVIAFICNHCPFVKHIQAKLVEVANQYQQRGIKFMAINANDITQYPEDSPLHMHQVALAQHYPFPYLYDESQAIARAYQAACTPDFYVFDTQLICVYRGRFDNSTPGNNMPVTGSDLSQALDAILNHQLPNPVQHPSIGCNIKWK